MTVTVKMLVDKLKLKVVYGNEELLAKAITTQSSRLRSRQRRLRLKELPLRTIRFRRSVIHWNICGR